MLVACKFSAFFLYMFSVSRDVSSRSFISNNTKFFNVLIGWGEATKIYRLFLTIPKHDYILVNKVLRHSVTVIAVHITKPGNMESITVVG